MLLKDGVNRGTTLVGAWRPRSAAAAGLQAARARPGYGGLTGRPYWRKLEASLAHSAATWAAPGRDRYGKGFGIGLLVKLALTLTRWAPGATRTGSHERRSIFKLLHASVARRPGAVNRLVCGIIQPYCMRLAT